MQQRQQDRAGAGADIGDAHGIGRLAAGANEFERRLDHRFRVGTRHQRVRGERETQAPEFLLAEDARDRLVLQPPLHQRGEVIGFVVLQRPLGRERHAGEIQLRCRADQQPRIELRRVELRRRELSCEFPPRGFDGEVGEIVPVHAAAPSVASSAA